MNRMALGDRIRTILITATITSIAWIVAGGTVIDLFGGGVATIRKAQPDVAAQDTVPSVAAEAPSPSSSAVSPDRDESRPLTPAETRGFAIPVAGVAPDDLVDSFADARSGGRRVHEAIDIMAPLGTPVLASQGGTVEKLFHSDRGGNTLYIRSPDGRTITYYAHLDRYAPGLAEGQNVRQGDRLGSVGSSGNASPDAPHLHFAIMQTTPDAGWWEPANAVNPYPILADTRR